MSKNKKELVEFLQVLTEYLILISEEENSPNIIQTLNKKLNRVLLEIQSKLVRNKFKTNHCQYVANQIDKLIYISAELSMRENGVESREFDDFKEKVWFLLETLEVYCLKKHNISVW